MTKRLLINGASGRIGKGVTFEVSQLQDSNLDLVALNDPAGIDVAVKNYQEKDPVHGTYPWNVKKVDDHYVSINGKVIPFFAEKDPTKIPMRDLGAQMVLECSGFYGDPKDKTRNKRSDNGGRVFLRDRVERVIETYPAKTADISMITGLNTRLYNSLDDRVVSNASCTTKASAMPVQALIDRGVDIYALSMDTTHAATGKDLAKLFKLFDDADHGKVTREQLEEILQIKTHSTGAAKATGLVIKSLEGKMAGMSYRVPTLDGSFTNLYFVAASTSELNSEIVNNMLRGASKDPRYQGRLGVFEGEDASTKDIVGRRENTVVIPSKTSVTPLPFGPEGKKAYLITVVAGYDNELGSSVDPVLLANYIADIQDIK